MRELEDGVVLPGYSRMGSLGRKTTGEGRTVSEGSISMTNFCCLRSCTRGSAVERRPESPGTEDGGWPWLLGAGGIVGRFLTLNVTFMAGNFWAEGSDRGEADKKEKREKKKEK